MKNRYFIQVLKYDGTLMEDQIEADSFDIKEGSIKFLSESYHNFGIISVYPVTKTIITKIEKLK